MMNRSQFALITPAAVALFLAGCTPQYPKCDKDEHCKQGEFCINGQCQQCRTDADCGAGKKCNSGRCDALEGYCLTADDCPDGKACINNHCEACTTDADCGEGGRCRSGRCLKPGQCQTNEDCPENQECQNGNCVAPPSAGLGERCTPDPVYFDFNEHVLTVETTATLQAGAACIKSVPNRKLRVEGHCDPQGTQEYNLALGDRRAQSVKRYLERLGVKSGRLRSVSKGELEAKGTDAASWPQDRKAIFIWE